MGRPLLDIDPDEVEKLAAMGCTQAEIADFFGCSVDTLAKRFADKLKEGKAKGVVSMKRQLFHKVQKGDLSAMIWWGKNFANMSDKVETKVEQKQETTFKIGWADESDQLNPPEKDATPAPDSGINEEIQASSLGTSIGEDHQRHLDHVEETSGGTE